ncbi:hypothetical protein GTP23_21575 [Pseudoduganella sp. FT93W]|uniref:HNH endonuclease n=1 Tax=Duganella fentianensis TaxID=2692177 RepID=A0A845I6G9_9BURK|nr:hypothetical protein [Duganella fentianensis]MYN47636.1 hypothetical protein [Duganella fentianensis]
MGGYSKRINSWAGFAGTKEPGFCVICGRFGELTRDHVPPRGCAQIANAVLSRLTMGAPGEGQPRNTIYIQGGLKFQTQCATCNNERLGLHFDPELKHFVDGMHVGMQAVARNVVLPRIIRLEANLHLVARSIIGHVLAAHSANDTQIWRQDIGASESLRQYFLHPDRAFPEEWRLYCWPYLSRKQVILRHASWMDVSLSSPAQKTVYGHVLKFLPFGFWLVHNQPMEFVIDALDITPRGAPDAARETCSFDLRLAPHHLYPENPSGHRLMLFANEQSSVATPDAKTRTSKR